MLKSYCVLLIFLLASFTIYSQDIKICGYQGYQTIEEVTTACDLQYANRSENSTEDAEQVVDDILDKVGLFRNFLIEECENINNALAVTMPLEGGDLNRYILYDLEFFKKVSSTTGTDWGLTSILAHEVGHHLNGHTLKSGGSNHKVELQADEFSGFVLARMKCSLEDAQSAVSKLLPDKASSTHPAKQDRLNAIANGWNRGNGNVIEVKKITEEQKKKVIENEVISGITAEQVISNYIDAIGGQEKISKVKTKRLSAYSNTELIQNGNVSEFEYYSVTSLLTPIIKLIEFSKTKEAEIYEEKLYLKGAFYERVEGDEEWKMFSKGNMENANLAISHFIEYSYLVNNVALELEGVEMVEGQKCYKIKFPKAETFKTGGENWTMNLDASLMNYYSVETGLLVKTIVIQDSVIETRNENGPEKSIGKSLGETVVSNYKEVKGILFPFNGSSSTKVYRDQQLIQDSLTSYEYEKIEVNPKLDTSDFIVKY